MNFFREVYILDNDMQIVSLIKHTFLIHKSISFNLFCSLNLNQSKSTDYQ